MKQPPIEIRVGDLKPAMVGLGKVISTRTSSPALHCVKIESLTRNRIQLTATDLDVTLRIEVPVTENQKFDPFSCPSES